MATEVQAIMHFSSRLFECCPAIVVLAADVSKLAGDVCRGDLSLIRASYPQASHKILHQVARLWTTLATNAKVSASLC